MASERAPKIIANTALRSPKNPGREAADEEARPPKAGLAADAEQAQLAAGEKPSQPSADEKLSEDDQKQAQLYATALEMPPLSPLTSPMHELERSDGNGSSTFQ